tara:strand:- start:1899 stop:4298 length:2400 start_codon:yes stop_codon:yes gene_type:complete
MSNTIYVDANRLNCHNLQGNTNEWTYKLNTELELPKGTQISVQNSFINLKGITGGSVEIPENINERITFYHYITEQPQFAPMPHMDDDDNTWCRQTLGMDIDNFNTNFTGPITGDDAKRLLRGTVIDDAEYFGKFKQPDFVAYGGSNMMLPLIKMRNFADADGTERQYAEPDFSFIDITIPKGTYSIGSIAQLIEDQINGKVINTGTKTKPVLKREDDPTRRSQKDFSNYTSDIDYFDGQPYSKPLCRYVSTLRRDYEFSSIEPKAPFADPDYGGFIGFTNMEAFGDICRTNTTFGSTVGATNSDGSTNVNAWSWNYIKQEAPVYFFRNNFDSTGSTTGSAGADGETHIIDPVEAISGYRLYQYDADPHNNRYKLIGTSNFQFKYDETQNAYTIGGLHNQIKVPSHDRFAGKNVSAGQPCINFKRVNNDAVICQEVNPVGHADAGKPTVGALKARAEILSVLNSTQTRDMGISIVNWGLETALRLGDRTKTIAQGGDLVPRDDTQPVDDQIPLMRLGMRFGEYFTTEKKAREAWETTLWARLGFEYDDIQNHAEGGCFGATRIYNRPSGADSGPAFPNYGFTTDQQIDNSVISTVSGLNNPSQYNATPAPKKGDHTGTPNIVSDFQLYNLDRMALPEYAYGGDPNGKNLFQQGQYAGGLLTASNQVPVVIADVGGVIASRLPTLSDSPYFLITSDVCDNYKDNVKKGDVLPLLGMVPKTNLSNQDFISSQSDIVQTLSSSKVINKISIKVLNADLTAPDLEKNSSVLLKIVRPNTTPTALLQEENPKIAKEIEGASITY